MVTRRSWAEPFKIKVIEPIKMTTRGYREQCLEEAGYNTFLLRSRDVYIDLLTDSGTGAMSDNQWAGMMMGDEAYAGSRNFDHLVEAVRDIYGYRYVVPTHQGRGAEHILSQMMIEDGDLIPGNMYFTTTKLHQELAGGTFIDVITDHAFDPESEYPFKGNIDLDKLRAVVDENSADRIPYISFEANVNMAGGQPVSMQNFREVYRFCQSLGIKVMLDATRLVENAYFIKQRENGYADQTIAQIVREICSLSDGATVSGKKDCLVNIGGFLALNDPELYEKATHMVVIFEGLHTYGGMAGRDMEAMARGIRESVDYEHIRARVGQVEYLGKKLLDAGVPIVVPVGGHAVYLDARRFLPHLDQELFPAQALAAAIYADSGVRTMERGLVSAGRDPVTRKNIRPPLELVRMTLPRRVYTQAHMDVSAESVTAVYDERNMITGLKMVYEPQNLRFFQARFSRI